MNWPQRWSKAKPASGLAQSEYRFYSAVHPFDERFGVQTGGLLYDLGPGCRQDATNNGYFAVAPSILRQALADLALEYWRFTFLDIGSGKGRALLLAAEYPFREITGVEISAKLHRIALHNIRRYEQRAACFEPARKIRSVRADAAEFQFPPGPLVIYVWNAFAAPVMERVLANLQISLLAQPREIYLLYLHPELESMLDDQSWIEKLWVKELALSEEDYAAWAFPSRTEVCAAYRLLPA